MSFLLQLISGVLLLISGSTIWAATPSSPTSSSSTDPVPLVVTFLGTALIGLWIWARKK